MIKIYCYNRCSTCQKALKFLDENNIKYDLIDIKENNPDLNQIKELHQKSSLDIKKLFNTSGLLYKELELSKKLNEMTLDKKYELLASNGMLVKRPILITDNNVLFGFKIDEWKKVLGI
jgi:arsenate reductase